MNPLAFLLFEFLVGFFGTLLLFLILVLYIRDALLKP